MPLVKLVPVAVCLLCTATVSGADQEWQSLLPHIVVNQDAVMGEWRSDENQLAVGAAAGARLALPVAPVGEYDFRVSFTRRTGSDSIALIFAHGGRSASFEIDAWGSHLGGLQSIAGDDLRSNPTRKPGQQLENGRRYTMTVEVRTDHVRALLDGEVIAAHQTTGSDLSVVGVWSMPQAGRLGIGAWSSETTFHSVDVRAVGSAPLAISRTAPPRTPGSSSTPPMPSPMPQPAPAKAGRRKHVLIVIANQDFFYREYGDPRAELEQAGIRVTVAAGRKAACRPHAGSGQGADGGIVQADLALADVKADDYDAILFSGGWGASAYQYAFNGRYSDPTYNGDRAVKVEVNRVINEFLAQDKYLAALCNGVSIPAWGRVDGQSPLRGKRVCAPVRDAAPGIYNGRQAQPSCRWHPEVNGARLSPPGAVGDPRTNTDDVIVDGRIITGEDDPSAREMGRTLVRVLTQ